jgi:hypothetical protein
VTSQPASPQPSASVIGSADDGVKSLDDQIRDLKRQADELHSHLAQFEKLLQQLLEAMSHDTGPGWTPPPNLQDLLTVTTQVCALMTCDDATLKDLAAMCAHASCILETPPPK